MATRTPVHSQAGLQGTLIISQRERILSWLCLGISEVGTSGNYKLVPTETCGKVEETRPFISWMTLIEGVQMNMIVPTRRLHYFPKSWRRILDSHTPAKLI